jgi:peptidylprolyl isomerase
MIKRNFLRIVLSLTFLLMITLVSCDPGRKYEKEEAEKIQNYLVSNFNQTYVLKQSGLYYNEVEAGSGAACALNDTAYVKYTGTFVNGLKFDSNIGTTDTLIRPVNSDFLLPGLAEGLTYMKVGGKANLLLPSKLAYGPAGYFVYDSYGNSFPYIPGYTPLIFYVELVRIKAGPGK